MNSMKNDFISIANDIMMAAQLASALEVSGTPKPGNVHRNADFIDTRFEHYLAGSIAIGPHIRDVALKGIRAGLDRIKLNEIRIGKHIKEAIHEVKLWHKGGNTHLGIILLFIPLAASAGFMMAKFGKIEPDGLRSTLSKIIKATTFQDAIDVCDAILESSASALGRLEAKATLDLMNIDIKRKIVEQKLSLYELMKVSSEWDNVAKELTTGMKISFNLGYKTLLDVYEKTGDINIATVHTFLTILAKYPDTLIARKAGLKHTQDIREAVKIGLIEAKKFSRKAERILRLGGLISMNGKRALNRFDKKLRDPKNKFNPGTTADIVASSLMIAILCGMRI
ncbi:MAG: triphosphoribosyl-dephospho-CoA synthase [archaeon]|nr:triphosphoribosyl-dephospho-CoA synthase [archaeon]